MPKVLDPSEPNAAAETLKYNLQSANYTAINKLFRDNKAALMAAGIHEHAAADLSATFLLINFVDVDRDDELNAIELLSNRIGQRKGL